MKISKENLDILCAIKANIEKTAQSMVFSAETSEEINERFVEILRERLHYYAERVGYPQFNELLREIVLTGYEQIDFLPFMQELNPKVSYNATYQVYLRFDTGEQSGIKQIGSVTYIGKNTSDNPSQIALGAITSLKFDQRVERFTIEIEVSKEDKI